MIDLFEIKGPLTRDDVESHFLKLVQDRFVAQATPVWAKKPPNAPPEICSGEL